jgi:hypothetical protein
MTNELLVISFETIKERILDTYELEGVLSILGIQEELEFFDRFDIGIENVLDEYHKLVMSKLEDFNLLTDTDYYV